MVYGWVPCNPPVEKPRNWAFLGLLPAPVRGESDITELFLRKLEEWRQLQDKKYHVPLNRRVWRPARSHRRPCATVAPALSVQRSAGFQACCIADFQVGCILLRTPIGSGGTSVPHPGRRC